MNAPVHIFDRVTLARRRNRIAKHAASVDYLLTRSVEDLLDRLTITRRTFTTALDFGAHDGRLAAALGSLPGMDLVVASESADQFLVGIEGTRVLADEEALPFRDGAFDLVISALTLQHVNDLPGTLLQIRRALRPDGLFLASLLGGDTLTELRQAMLAAEDELDGGVSPRVAPFADVRDLGALLQRAGFALPVADADVVTVTFPTPIHLMHELRAMGCTNVLAARRRRPLRRATLLRACEIYAERFADADGRIRATFEIVTLTGWVPHESQQKPLRPGSARMRLADALGVEESKASDTASQRDLPDDQR
jgi:SAM-dependent methyltransferase